MPKVALSTYRGLAPRISPRALPNEGATVALNARLLSGDLEAWRDILDIHSLEKSGPTNTQYLFGLGTTINGNADGFWFNWAQSEVNTAGGFVDIDVARVPVVGDATELTIFTGALIHGVDEGPQITNVSLAVGSDTSPWGPYPLNSIPLAVDAPLVAPMVVNTPGADANITIVTTYTSTFTGWSTGNTGGNYGSWAVVATNPGGNQTPYQGTTPPNSALSFPTPLSLFGGPYYAGNFQAANSNYASPPSDFDFANCDVFSLSFLLATDQKDDDHDSCNGYCLLLSGGNSGYNSIGGLLQLNFASSFDGGNGSITWQDQSGGGSPVVIAANGTVTNTHSYRVFFFGINNGIVGTTRTFTIGVLVTDLHTGATVGYNDDLTCTYAGENTFFGGVGGHEPNSTYIFLGNVSFSVSSPPPAFVPVYSDYVYTYDTALGFESGPSPASNVVQVDNGNINTITIPVPPVDEDVTEIFLYRAATGSSGTEFLQVDNGLYPDGGFPICIMTGNNTAITLTTQTPNAGVTAPQVATAYFFIATATNAAGNIDIAVNGSAFIPVMDTSGNFTFAPGAITTGQPYSVEYQAPTAITTEQASTAGQATVLLPTTAGVAVGDSVSDTALSIPAGTTVSAVTFNTSVTLSNNLVGTGAPVGDTLTFSVPYFTLYSSPNGFVYVDITPTANLGTALTTTDFDPPPNGLQGILALPNGIMAGFDGNTLYLSAQGFPYAYPLNYALATDREIIAIGAIDTTVLILTDEHPYTAYGATPDAFTMTREEFIQGCVSKRSVSYLRGYGIVYASTDGIYAYSGQGNIRNLTENLFTIREWVPLNPPSIIGIVHQGLYFFWYITLNGTEGGYILDPNPQGFGLVSLDFHAISVALNPAADDLFMVLGQGAIAGDVEPPNNEQVQWDAATTLRPYVWTSKLYQFPYPQSFMMARLWSPNYNDFDITLEMMDGNQNTLYTVSPFSNQEFVVVDDLLDEFQFTLSGTGTVQPLWFVENARQLFEP